MWEVDESLWWGGVGRVEIGCFGERLVSGQFFGLDFWF